MDTKDELKEDIRREFSNEDGRIFRKYKNHALFKFLQKEDWESVIKTLEEILKNKYSMISSKAWNFRETRYYGDERGGEIYIERIRRIQAEKQENINSLIEGCKRMQIYVGC